MRMGKFIALVVGLAVLSGCASYPFSENLRNQAVPLNLTQVKANPQTTRGVMVIWGGRIINTINTTNGGEIYVLELPLGHKERPNADYTASTGRFIALSPEFLDPAVYARGRLVTIAGRTQGVRNQRLQTIMYRYPLLKVQQIHLWTGRQSDIPLWWDGGTSWYYPGGPNGYQGEGGHPN